MKVRLVGVEALSRLLARAGQELKAGMNAPVTSAAADALAKATGAAPVKTGRLRASASVGPTTTYGGGRRTQALVDFTAPYAPFVEVQQGRPVRRAVKPILPAFRREVHAIVDRAIAVQQKEANR